MNKSNPRTWLVGGLLSAALLLALGWSLLISPRMAAVAQTREQAVELEDQALLIQGQAAQLQRQAEELPAQIRALRRIQSKIPAAVDVPALLRDIEQAAVASDVRLDTLAPGQITVYSTESTDKASTKSQSSSNSSEPQASPDPTTAAPAPIPSDLGQDRLPEGVGLSYVPVAITATGDFANIQNFTRRIETLQRAYLITGVQLARATSTDDKRLANPLTLSLATRIFVTNDRLRNLPDQALQQVKGGD